MELSDPAHPAHSFYRDASPIPGDCESIQDLFGHIRAFVRQYPGATVLCADDSGTTYKPPRVPRVGFTAFKETSGLPPGAMGERTEVTGNWTITLARLKETWSCLPQDTIQQFTTSAGRQEIAYLLEKGEL
jgi:hypothetical protein